MYLVELVVAPSYVIPGEAAPRPGIHGALYRLIGQAAAPAHGFRIGAEAPSGMTFGICRSVRGTAQAL